jgi:glycosyltransferase involved in cell wall biosynthesis
VIEKIYKLRSHFKILQTLNGIKNVSSEWTVVHPDFDPVGGGERVCLEVIKAIYEYLGSKSSLLLIKKPQKTTSLRLLYRYYHYIDKLIWISDSANLITLKLTLSQVLLKLSKKHSKIFVSGSYSSALLGTAIYLHYPFNLDLHGTFEGVKKTYGILTIEINDLLNFIYNFNKLELQNKILIFNSTYTLRKTIQLAKKWSTIAPATYNIISNAKKYIVFPPVDSKIIAEKVPLKSDREDIIVILGRISREKKIEYGIFILRLLHQFFNIRAKLFIIGSLNDIAYYQYLKSLAKRMHLEDHVSFFLDVDEKTKMKLLSKGKVLFHPMPGEHFGIAIVETMAAGLIPVVSKESGIGSLGILDERWLYLDLKRPLDIARILVKALNNWSLEYAYKLRKIALMFDSENFRQRIGEILRDVH